MEPNCAAFGSKSPTCGGGQEKQNSGGEPNTDGGKPITDDGGEHDIFFHYLAIDQKEGNRKDPYICNKCGIEEVRYPDGTVRLRNRQIEKMESDYLYHVALGTSSHDLVQMFSDIKFICMGGTPERMEQFAYYILDEIGNKLPTGTQLLDISRFSHRFCMYKVGPVLSVSHGMGGPSIGILLHELIKLMYHSKCKDPIFFRTGTSGGIGLEPGTVVISEGAIDGMLTDQYQVPMLGKMVQRPAKLDKKLALDLKALAANEPYETTIGTTMCAEDFYEGQARSDGAFCEYSDAEKMEFLNHLSSIGVKNIEMEGVPFAALTYRAGIKSAVVCVTLLDRLKGDQITTPQDIMMEWQSRPQVLVTRYIKKYTN